jgi:hypothetical protein
LHIVAGARHFVDLPFAACCAGSHSFARKNPQTVENDREKFRPFLSRDFSRSRPRVREASGTPRRTPTQNSQAFLVYSARIFFFPVLPKDSLAAVSRARVEAMLTVWLSFLVFAGRACSSYTNR